MPIADWTSVPCSTGCGRPVPIIVGDTPREPARCDACRPAGVPAVRDVPCDRYECDHRVAKIVGAQRRRWEMGRPVYCSKVCRTLATTWVESCGWCRTAIVANRKRVRHYEVTYCSNACQGAAKRRPPRRCALCRELFQTDRSASRFCSRPCAARSKDRAAVEVRTCPVCGRVDIVTPETARRHPTCSQACGARYHNRPGAARRVDTPQVRNRH